MIKYLIKQSGRRGDGETFVIELPDEYELTFSSVNPASTHPGSDGYCLRIYKTKPKKLVAVFENVISFRDLNIPLVRQVRSEIGNAKWESDSLGNISHEESIMVKELMIPEPDLFD